jgi:hypothetical protein
MNQDLYEKLRELAIENKITYGVSAPMTTEFMDAIFISRALSDDIEKQLVITRTKHREVPVSKI